MSSDTKPMSQHQRVSQLFNLITLRLNMLDNATSNRERKALVEEISNLRTSLDQAISALVLDTLLKSL